MIRTMIFTTLISISTISFAVERSSLEYYLRDTNIRVADDQDGTSILLWTDEIFEEPGSPVLAVDQYPALDKMKNVVLDNDDVVLAITGHTDSIMPPHKRYEVSYMYAQAIANYLVSAGVNPERIHKVSGEADTLPMARVPSLEGRHVNRRVEITFLRETPEMRSEYVHDRYELPAGSLLDEEIEREEREEYYKGMKK
jgi:flagellar motor protein MotB